MNPRIHNTAMKMGVDGPKPKPVCKKFPLVRDVAFD